MTFWKVKKFLSDQTWGYSSPTSVLVIQPKLLWIKFSFQMRTLRSGAPACLSSSWEQCLSWALISTCVQSHVQLVSTSPAQLYLEGAIFILWTPVSSERLNNVSKVTEQTGGAAEWNSKAPLFLPLPQPLSVLFKLSDSRV